MIFIPTHPIIALLLIMLFVAALTVIAAGFLKPNPPVQVIKPEDLIDADFPCSWCQVEQAIKAQPHESHGICKRHAAQLLADARRLNHAA